MMRATLFTLFGLCMMLSVPIVTLASAKPVRGQPVLVIAAPWGPNLGTILLRAKANEIGLQRTAIAALSNYDRPGLPEALKDAGAWFVLDGEGVAFLCGHDANA